MFDRKTLVAALAIAVVTLSAWPVTDEPPVQLAIYLCGGGLAVALGVSERARSNRLVVGGLGALFVVQGGYTFVSRSSPAGVAVALVYVTIGAATLLYQSGVAPWGHPDDGS
ncbi:MAG: hypothetical protein ABEI80_06380 [Haloplanus sp.]